MIVAILQARLSSTRLPGKVLKELHGQPMIVRQIERIRRSTLIDHLVVATSVDPSDDPLAEEMRARGIDVRRGALDDVVARFASVVHEFAPDTIVRLTADCPLADSLVIDAVIRAHLDAGADYTSNTLAPSYPDGLDVECITASAFARMRAADLSVPEREHVTMGLYSHPDQFSLHNVSQSEDHSAMRWTVDVADDLEFVRTVYSSLYDTNPAFGQSDVVELLETHPELSRTEQDLGRNSAVNQ